MLIDKKKQIELMNKINEENKTEILTKTKEKLYHGKEEYMDELAIML